MVDSTAILYNSNRLAFAYFLTDAFISLMDPLFIFNALPYFVSKVCLYNSYYVVCLCTTVGHHYEFKIKGIEIGGKKFTF